MWSSHSQLTVNLIPTYFRRYYGYEEHDFVTGFQNDHEISIGERKRMSIRTPTAWAYWNSTERDGLKKQKEG
jgi:hypothetical protein